MDPSCFKLRCCRGDKETMEHIFWTCPCAQACCQKFICHWTGERWDLGHLQGFVQYSASRYPPALSKVVVVRIEREHPDEEHAYATAWARLWLILSSVCITSLWIQRNRVTFQRGSVTIGGSVKEFWQTGLRQLRVVAKREYRRADTKIKERVCYYVLDNDPGNQESHHLR